MDRLKQSFKGREQIMPKCVNGKKLKVMYANGSYYIGTLDEDGFPFCRTSYYYESEQKALNALNSKTFIQRSCVENEFCRGSSPRCFVGDK